MRRALLLFAMLAGCVAREGAQSVVDVQVASVTGRPLTEVDGSAPSPMPSGRCVVRLDTTFLRKSSPGCYLDSHVQKTSGTLAFPCEGTGDATADFEDDHYVGKVENGRVSLERSTELDWEDGCRWGTKAVLAGPLPPGDAAGARQHLDWTYEDRVVRGNGCSGVCRANGTIETSPNDGSGPAHTPLD